MKQNTSIIAEAFSNETASTVKTFVHDLRGHLNTIKSGLTLLRRSYSEEFGSSGGQIIDLICDANSLLHRLVSDFLLPDGTIKESGSEMVDLKEVVECCIEDLKLQIVQLEATFSYDDNLPSIYGDRVQLCRVFHNLFQNALKYRRHGVKPRIRIRAMTSTNSEGNNVHEVNVEDNGIGFTNEESQTLFVPFRRLRNPGIEGTGLGLAICKDIIARYGGSVRAEGNPGMGATFILIFPTAGTGSSTLKPSSCVNHACRDERLHFSFNLPSQQVCVY